MPYEVEIRFIADSPEDAFARVPFLKDSLGAPKEWSSEIVGRSIFDEGRLLRAGWSRGTAGRNEDDKRWAIGYKELDVGNQANIREEWGEETTTGIADSEILAQMGIVGAFASPDAVMDALAAAGHQPFMGFFGVDRLGCYEPLGVHTKLAQCPAILDERLLVELELEAGSLAEAREAEAKLIELATELGIVDLLERDEPPTMLCKRTIGG